MAAVTQTVPNFLGGVSKQTDIKKQPGQVRNCINAYPDPTFGLMKRPGFKFIKNIYTPSSGTDPELKDAKWFFIKRDNLETYIGCILDTTNDDDSASIHASDPIKIWNKDGTACTVTYESSPADAKLYLDTTRDNYDVLTVQDTSIITNKTKEVEAKAVDTDYISKSKGTVRIKTVAYSIKYEINLKVGSTDYPVSFTTLNAEDLPEADSTTNPSDEKYNTAKRILDELKTALQGLTITDHTLEVTKLDSTLELVLKSTATGTPYAPFELTTTDSQGGIHIDSFNEKVRTQADLPAESTEGRVAKVAALGGESDTFWLKFFADNGEDGKGNWEETVDPSVSTGMKAETLPHELFNSSENTFVFRQPKEADGTTLAWKDRVVGDTLTNSDPSFVGYTIQQAFYHNNRLGFLTKDNVSMSKVNGFFNFYFTSALTSTDADPIDINCSSIRPAVLHAVIPTAQGLILFSKNQQFIMFSDAEILTPSSAVIRGISNYEMDSTIDPVDVGTTINFVSKTPSYTRIFGMQTRGSEESPMVIDIGKVVSEWVPDTVNSLLASPQNSLIALYGDNRSAYEGDNNMYIFKTYSVGDKMLMQAWFNWELPGNIQHASIDSDTMWSVVETNGVYSLISASLTQTPEETIMTTADGKQINPHMDMYTAANNGATGSDEKKVVYDTAGNFSKCYIPYADLTNLNPVILIAGNASQDFAGVTEFGFTVSPARLDEVATDDDGTYFKVKGKNLESSADNVYVGYQYNYDVELPKTYYKLTPDGSQYDYTAALTIARMKFAVGLSSVVGFKVKRKGYIGDSWEGTVADAISGTSGKSYKVPFLLKEENGIRITLDGALQPSTSYSVARTVVDGNTIDNSDTVTFNTAPNDEVDNLDNTTTPAQKIKITTDTWYDVQPTQQADQYLSDDVPLTEESIFTIPIHQRSDNFNLRVFSNSPFPVSLASMMWEGQYSPRFYRRT